jgi:hypothetical protein
MGIPNRSCGHGGISSDLLESDSRRNHAQVSNKKRNAGQFIAGGI